MTDVPIPVYCVVDSITTEVYQNLDHEIIKVEVLEGKYFPLF